MSVTVERLTAEVEVDTKSAQRDLLAFKAFAESTIKSIDADKEINFKADFKRLKAEVLAEVKAIEKTIPPIHVDVKTDRNAADQIKRVATEAGGASSKFSGFRKELNDGWSSIRRFNQGMSAMGTLIGLIKLPAMVLGVGMLVQGLNAAMAAVTSLLTPLGSLVGLLGALPALGVGLLSVFGAVKMGMGDTFKAIGAYNQQVDSGVDKTKQLKSAQEGLIQANHSLMLAQEGVADAEKNLIEARKQAARQLIDMRFQSEQVVIDEERAVIGLTRARKNLAEVNKGIIDDQNNFKQVTDEFTGRIYDIAQAKSDDDTELRKKEATLDVRQAELSLRRVQEDRKRTVEDLWEAERKGVEGSDLVQQAIRGQRDAAWSLRSALLAVKDAQETLNDQQTGAGGADPFLEAYNKLGPAGKAFVDFYKSEVKPIMEEMKKEAQEGLLPGMLVGAKKGLPFLKLIKDNIGGIASQVGEFFADLGRLFGSESWLNDSKTLFKENDELLASMRRGLIDIIDGLRDVAIAAKPVTDWVGDMAEKWGKQFKDWAEFGRNSGELTSFFEKSTYYADKLFKNMGLTWEMIKMVAQAAEPLGDWLIDKYTQVVDKTNEWMRSAEGQKKLTKYFQDQKGPLTAIWRLLRDTAKAILQFDSSGFVRVLDALREKALPAFVDLLENLYSEDFGVRLVETLSSIVTLLEHTGGMSTALGVVLDVVKAIADAFSFLMDNIPGLTGLVHTLAVTFALWKGIKFTAAITGFMKFGRAGLGVMKMLTDKTSLFRLGLAGVTDPAAGKWNKFGGLINKVFANSKTGAYTFGSVLKGALAVGGAMALVTAIALIGKALYDAYQRAREFKREVNQALADVKIEEAEARIESMKDSVKANEDQWDSWSDSGIFSIERIGGAIPAIKGKIDNLFAEPAISEQESLVNYAKTQINAVSGILDMGKGDVIDYMQQLNFNPAEESWQSFINKLSDSKILWQEITTEINAAKDAADRYFGEDSANTPTGRAEQQSDMTRMQNQFMTELASGKFKDVIDESGNLNPNSSATGDFVGGIEEQLAAAKDLYSDFVESGEMTAEEARAAFIKLMSDMSSGLNDYFGGDTNLWDIFNQSYGDMLEELDAAWTAADEKRNTALHTDMLAARDAAKETGDLTEANKVLSGAFDTLGEDLNGNEQILKDLIGTHAVARESWKKSGIKNDELKEKIDAANEKLIAQVSRFTGSRESAIEYINGLGLIPPIVDTRVGLDTEEAKAKLADLWIRIDELRRRFEGILDENGQPTMSLAAAEAYSRELNAAEAEAGRIEGGRAAGGESMVGKTYLVGELGPEWLHQGAAGAVIEPMGRIGTPRRPRQLGEGGNPELLAAIERIERAMSNMKKVEQHNEFKNQTDPVQTAAALAWQLEH